MGDKSNANATTRGGLQEVVVTHYDNWQSIKFALEEAYCIEDGTPQLAQRNLFQDDVGEVKVAGSFMWNQLGHDRTFRWSGTSAGVCQPLGES